MPSSQPEPDSVSTGEATSAMVPPVPLESPPQRPAPAEAETASLVVARGPGEGTEFPVLASSTILGRGRSCDIVLDDVTVSREHAEIRHDGQQFVLQDKGSLNGTYLNRSAVDQAKLAEGDEVWIGKFRLVFRTSAA